jgi:hypothetical protein
MRENIKQLIRKMQAGSLSGKALEETEFWVIQALCGADAEDDLNPILHALGASGTILAVPALCAHLQMPGGEIKALVTVALKMIKARGKDRGSKLPDAFYAPEHWRPGWQSSKNAFLSYVQIIADMYIRNGHNEGEIDRIGGILAKEMDIDISPYATFADFRICQTDWDFKADYKKVLDRMAEEKLLADMEKIGVTESDVTILTDCLMDMRYDYIVARLKLKGNLEYYRFVLKMAECLNEPELERE